jgi:hypothetical protein
MDIIQKNILSNLTNTSFSLEINGTNDYTYKFSTIKVFFKYQNKTFNDSVIYLEKPMFTIIFNLSIYERETNDIFYMNSFSSDISIINKMVTVNIKLESITYNKNEDFSFYIKKVIDDKNNNITVFFNNLDETNFFKYLLYEEKNIDLYGNKTLIEKIKDNIFDNLFYQFEKQLFSYPECDSLYYFNSMIDYILISPFNEHIPLENMEIYDEKVNDFHYEEIIRNNTDMIFKNVFVNIFIKTTLYYGEEGIDDDVYDKFMLDYIIIHRNFTIHYSPVKIDKEHLLDAFKSVVKATKGKFKF